MSCKLKADKISLAISGASGTPLNTFAKCKQHIAGNDDCCPQCNIRVVKPGFCGACKRVAGKTWPDSKWIHAMLNRNPKFQHRDKIISASVVGSVAKGSAHPGSDLDIAVIIKPVRGKTSLQISGGFHQRYWSDSEKPMWNGRLVDFQFFYEDDLELATYEQIPLSVENT